MFNKGIDFFGIDSDSEKQNYYIKVEAYAGKKESGTFELSFESMQFEVSKSPVKVEVGKKKEKEKKKELSTIVTYHVYYDGHIEKHIPKEIAEEFKQKYKYIYHDTEGNLHDICVAEWHKVKIWEKGSKKEEDTRTGGTWEKKVADGKTRYYKLGTGEGELIKIPFSGGYINYEKGNIKIKLKDNTNREYINPVAFASLIGALAECGYDDIIFNGFTSYDGTGAPSVSHINGKNGDLRYLRKDNSGGRTNLFKKEGIGWEGLDEERQNIFNEALFKFGWKRLLSQFYGENKDKLLIHCNNDKKNGHNDHLHIQGYKPNIITK